MMQFKAFWIKLPILGGIIHTNRQHWFKAVGEVSFKLFVASSPIWFGAFVLYLLAKKEGYTYLGYIKEILKTGDIIISLTSLLAPVLFFILSDDAEKPFPNRKSIGLVVLVIFAISSTVFSFQRAGIAYDNQAVLYISKFAVPISIFILLLATAYQNSIAIVKNPAQKMDKEDENFSHKLDKEMQGDS